MCLNDLNKYGDQHHSVFACFCHGFCALIQIYCGIVGFLQSFHTLSKDNSLPFCKLSTASFLKKRRSRDTVCTDSNHQLYETCSQYLQTLCKMECSPSQRNSRKWRFSGTCWALVTVNGWAGGSIIPRKIWNKKTTRTPTVQQHTGLEVLGLLCPVVTDGTHVWRLRFWRILLHHAPAQWSPCNDLACRCASSNTLPQVPQEKGGAWDHVSSTKKPVPESPNMFRYPRWRYENPM